MVQITACQRSRRSERDHKQAHAYFSSSSYVVSTAEPLAKASKSAAPTLASLSPLNWQIGLRPLSIKQLSSWFEAIFRSWRSDAYWARLSRSASVGTGMSSGTGLAACGGKAGLPGVQNSTESECSS